ncbi:hypothetical protein L3Y34_019590 [Caenorhabditis briggsae]|uniref:Uncharacterized protein n=1 Tax=Caenorhabditis briggsae TaxID=6238 RepID=A0AAE9DP29_CAEBR|nr:hypothetical protein L3Y34_019590 [Caenorhabditis briggsae]
MDSSNVYAVAEEEFTHCGARKSKAPSYFHMIEYLPESHFHCHIEYSYLLWVWLSIDFPYIIVLTMISDRLNGTPLVVSVKEETPIPSRQRNSSLLPDWKEDRFETRLELEVNNLARCRTKELKMRSRFGSWKGEPLLMFRGLERTE